MTTISLDQAQETLPDLIKRARDGEEIVIMVDGRQVLLSVVPRGKSHRGRGSFKGQLIVGPEFFEPLPEDELKAWDGRSDE